MSNRTSRWPHRRPTLLTARLVTLVASAALLAPTSLSAAQAEDPPLGARALTACTARITDVRYRPGDGSAGSVYGRIVVTNTSARSCTLHGYGGISYVGGGDGTQIGAASDREPATVRTVTLRPGQRARARIRMVEAANYPRRTCRPTRVDGFRVYLPGERHSVFVAHRTTGCRNARVHLLSGRPYRR